ncbi:MAG: hypothetical protein ACRER1_05115 [Gammaproteobacteria bacterium]
MTEKSERLRARLSTLQAQLAKEEAEEKRKARVRTQRTLTRAAHRSGLLAVLSQRKGAEPALLEQEFARLTSRLDRSNSALSAAAASASSAAKAGDKFGEMRRQEGEE